MWPYTYQWENFVSSCKSNVWRYKKKKNSSQFWIYFFSCQDWKKITFHKGYLLVRFYIFVFVLQNQPVSVKVTDLAW